MERNNFKFPILNFKIKTFKIESRLRNGQVKFRT